MGVSQSLRRRAENAASAKPNAYQFQPEDWPWVWAIRDPEVLDWRRGLSEEAMLKRQNLQDNLPVHIYGNVYLGNAGSVQDLAKLKKLGIRRVLNMAGSLAIKKSTILAYEKEGFDYKRITALDNHYYPLLERDWKESYDFIHDSEQDGNVVVHCVAGLNRSVLIVAADFMVSNKIPVLETMQHVRSQRGNAALHNGYFQEQLVALARISKLLGKPPGTEGSILENVAVPPPDSIPA
jgi:hypothetical protein